MKEKFPRLVAVHLDKAHYERLRHIARTLYLRNSDVLRLLIREAYCRMDPTSPPKA